MRPSVLVNFIKEDWYSQRRMLFWYFLTSLMLGLLLIFVSRNAWVLNQIKQHVGLDLGEFSLTALAILFMPYAISWMLLTNQTEKEYRSGFYPFVHTLPLTVKEIVTAKYISNFLMDGLMAIWLCGLWWIYELNFPDADTLTAWTALCMVVFFLAFSVLAILLGCFFRWGSGNLVYFVLFLLIIAGQFEFADEIAYQTIRWMDQFPFILWGIAVLLTICVWIICWHWSMKAYRKY